jgi:uncharacterized protein (DUF58 family)
MSSEDAFFSALLFALFIFRLVESYSDAGLSTYLRVRVKVRVRVRVMVRVRVVESYSDAGLSTYLSRTGYTTQRDRSKKS